tara:strand:+ start:724 stop:1551 length:828 start_codon:yes stop_codon:yes gene_type:complete
MKKLKLLDTFSGIGGFSYAAEKLVGGFETSQFIEIDPYCQKVLKKHWPNVPIHDDITTFTAKPFQYDLVCGGFPCQSISQIGTREGITETSKSGLWFQLLRTIRMVRPKYFILENVSAILSNGMDIILRDIYQTGFYECEWATFPASYLGAAHQRDRWYLLGISTDTNSFGYRGGSSERCAVQERQFLQREQTGGKMGSETKRCGINNFEWRNTGHRLNPNWREYDVKPTIQRAADGLSYRLDKSRIHALGNSLVPQCAAIPLQRVLDLENESQT